MDHLPLGPAPEAPLPRRATLTLLVGRVTTIKLVYWTALTATELALPALFARPFAEQLAASMTVAAAVSLATLVWASRAARAPDPRVGRIPRSVPTIATTFAATTVVASPASLPLLIVERQRSLDGCAAGACHLEALALWVAILAVGTFLIPAAFALSLPAGGSARSLGH